MAETLTPDVTLTERELETWRRFLRAHAYITRRLDADLHAAHDMTLSDYEVLLHLSRAPDRKMRMSELAAQVLLTRSGMTRLVQGLEKGGLVERVSCPMDGRGSYAQLTDAGRAQLEIAAATHLQGVRELFVAAMTAEKLDELGDLLGVLPGSDGPPDACG
jgi:DNA-binding MarR family transcriptional regulator